MSSHGNMLVAKGRENDMITTFASKVRHLLVLCLNLLVKNYVQFINPLEITVLTLTHSSVMAWGVHHSKFNGNREGGAICIVLKVQIDGEVPEPVGGGGEIQ